MTDLATWRDQVRRIADSGYSTLLMPDVPHWQPAPGPTLAFTAAQADLHVGTWVYASPRRRVWSTAWEAESLAILPEDPTAAAEEIQRRRRRKYVAHRHRATTDWCGFVPRRSAD